MWKKLKTRPVEDVIGYLKEKVDFSSPFKFVGLGNMEDVRQCLDKLEPYQALIQLGHDPFTLSLEDILSFYCLYSDHKDQHQQWYLQKLEQSPKDQVLLFGLGNLYYNSNQLPSAICAYQLCLKSMPSHRRVIEALALCALKLNDSKWLGFYVSGLSSNRPQVKYLKFLSTIYTS